MEEAIAYFDSVGWHRWAVVKGEKERIFIYDEEDSSEAKVKLLEALSMLSPGTYKLKMWKVKNGEAGTLQKSFLIKGENQIMGNLNTMLPTNWEQQLEKARNEGFKEGHEKATTENRITALEKRCDEIDVKLKTISDAVLELTDGDSSDNTSAIEQLSNISAMMPNFVSGIKALTPGK